MADQGRQAQVGEIQTVLGPIAAEQARVVLPHEHVFIDLATWSVTASTDEERDLWEAPVTIENLGRIRHGTWSNRANMVRVLAVTAPTT